MIQAYQVLFGMRQKLAKTLLDATRDGAMKTADTDKCQENGGAKDTNEASRTSVHNILVEVFLDT